MRMRTRLRFVALVIGVLAISLEPVVEAAEAILPGVVARSIGVGGVMWGTELRITNGSTAVQTVKIVDWIGSPGFRPSAIIVPAGRTVSVGGWDVLNPNFYVEDRAEPSYGTAIVDTPAGVLLEVGILAGSTRESAGGTGSGLKCPPWAGGYSYFASTSGDCNIGGGPVIQPLQGFFLPTDEVDLFWLETVPARRTNLYLVNADPVDGVITVVITGADGTTERSAGIPIAGRSVLQINDMFSKAPWSDVRSANDRPHNETAARARLTSDRRFLAMAYVISNENQTVGLSLPRVASGPTN